MLLVVWRSSWNFPVGIANNVIFIVLFVGSGLPASNGTGWWSGSSTRFMPVTQR